MEIDWSVGEVITALKKHGIEKNTLVIFTSDNGPWLNYGTHSGSAYPLREGKGTAWEGGQREPCIIQYPNKIKAGRTIDVPMMNIDILPTIAEVTHSKLPNLPIDGKSIWDIWTGAATESPQEAYYFYYKINELHGIRYKQWKMYFPHVYRSLNGRAGGEGGLPVKYDQNTLAQIELYDLSKDMQEARNLAAEFPAVVATIQAIAEKARVQLGDSLTDRVGEENRAVGIVKE